MDISTIYIKMCKKAEEIQKQAPEDLEGEFAFDSELNKAHQFGEYGVIKREKYIWLPRQDQLQEMIDEPIDICLSKFYEFLGSPYYPTPSNADFYLETVKRFPSMEQLWLAFTMKEKYGKVWDNKKKDWV